MKYHISTRLLCLAALGLGLAAGPAKLLAATQTVNIQGYSYQPASLAINTGDSVTWVQKDSAPHTVTSSGAPTVLNSPYLSLNQTFSYTFMSAGTFSYYCTVHPYMKGSVTVASVNQPPTVQITSPTEGALFKAPATVTLAATATDPDGTVSQVEFLDGAHSLGIVTTAPYSLVLTNLSPGPHPLTAKATDNQGASTVSAAVTIQVVTPPTVSLAAPGNGAVFLLPATIVLQATAAGNNATVDHVEFFAGTNSLGVAMQSPYNLNWTNVSAGTYVLTVAATDSNGLKTVSSAITINVTGAAAYAQHNLVSDIMGWADNTDTNLLNPWAIGTSPSGPFWISDNHAGLSTVYDTTGAIQSLVVTIPPPANGTPPAAPTGMVYNGGSNFLVAPNLPARFIFATEDGTISAWNSATNIMLVVDNSVSGTVYKGLALGSIGASNYLYAADFHGGKIDVFDSNFRPINLPGAFSDAALPAGYSPFGIQALGTNLYVAYALPDAAKHDDVGGPGHGFINIFTTSGQMVKRLVSQGPLNSPWGMAMAPAGFGSYSGALLVGNFGDGHINAFDPNSGNYWGPLRDVMNNPIAIEGLWGLKFGNGSRGGDANRLYFTAGISGGGSLEDHGLFGSISAQPVINLASPVDLGTAVSLSWVGGTGPYLLQRKANLSDTAWFDVLTTQNSSATVPKEGPTGFFRVMDKATVTVTAFTALLNGANEVPAVSSGGSGMGILSLEGNQLSYYITYSGLSGNAVAAHIHGPADASHAAGVLFPLNGFAGSSGVLSGVQTLTSDQMNYLLTGQTYVNIHTANNPGGEIRGQVILQH